jgi:hypothetical protein
VAFTLATCRGINGRQRQAGGQDCAGDRRRAWYWARLAAKLGAEGAHLVVNDLDAAPLEETIATVRSHGCEALAVPGDITVPEFADRFIAAVLGRFGKLDVIINNAGFTWDNIIQRWATSSGGRDGKHIAVLGQVDGVPNLMLANIGKPTVLRALTHDHGRGSGTDDLGGARLPLGTE